MITKSTVLILGAGASKPYGYPLGSELRQRLIDENLFHEAIKVEVLKRQDVVSFCETFRYSGMPSIDAFLSRRGHHKAASDEISFEVVGKLGIALALRERATFGGLFHRRADAEADHIDVEDNWYEYLWVRLTDGVTKENIHRFGNNRLKIVTFNYDTSLEQYLFTALKNAYGLDDIHAMRYLSQIPIHHVYGQLKFGTHELCPDPLMYGVGGRDLIADDADSIQVIDEHRNDSIPVLEACSSSISHADRIVCLGFGFDTINVQRLGIVKALHDRCDEQFRSNAKRAPDVICTTLGLTPWERTQVHDVIFGGVKALSAKHANVADHYLEKAMASIASHADCKSLMLLRSSGALS